MPFDAEGRSGTQVKRSDELNWICGRPLPREDLTTIPFIGEVGGETPAFCNDQERRRRDVGPQIYGHGVPRENATFTDMFGLLTKQKPAYTDVTTSRGKVQLATNNKDLGFLPSADVVDFLRSEYLGSRARTTPQRYFPI